MHFVLINDHFMSLTILLILLSTLSFGDIRVGEDANFEDSPWAVSFWKKNKYYCGGSLIKPNLILTAAHCVYDEKSNHLMKLRKIKLKSGHRKLNKTKRLPKIKAIHLHPEYTKVNPAENDIAIVELEEDADLDKLRMTLIPLSEDYHVANELRLFSYGTNCFQPSGQNLHQLELKITSRERWIQNIDLFFRTDPNKENKEKNRLRLENRKAVKTQRMIFYEFKNGNALCPGDSGSGVVTSYNGSPVLQAIVSRGTTERVVFGILENVSIYYSWIKSFF